MWKSLFTLAGTAVFGEDYTIAAGEDRDNASARWPPWAIVVVAGTGDCGTIDIAVAAASG